jgi:PIN domain nuclease of toxin-antitoxin system
VRPRLGRSPSSYALGRLPLAAKPETHVPRIREIAGIQSLPVDEESALYAARLPKLHADPFDRVLVAQAIVHGMVILTPDDAIAQYGVRVLW